LEGEKPSASLLPEGSFVSRHFKSNEFEYFLQDSWRVRPNLTITFGLRHTLLQTPYETKGQQIAPTVDTHQWYLERGRAAAEGRVFEDDLLFTPVGKMNHKPAYWAKQKVNIAPRIAVVYSPDTKTSLRSGFGMYYDHFGEALTSRFSRLGSFGLSSQFQSPANTVNYATAPRFTGPHDLPIFPFRPPLILSSIHMPCPMERSASTGVLTHTFTLPMSKPSTCPSSTSFPVGSSWMLPTSAASGATFSSNSILPSR
jgi:hypothetical protein